MISFDSNSQILKVKKNEKIPFEQLSSAGETTQNIRLYVVGETHYLKGNNDVFLNCFIRLNQEYNVNQIVLGDGAGKGVLVNEYLRTGNDLLLHFLASNREEVKLFEQIFFQKTQGCIDSIEVNGIDYEDDLSHSVAALGKILERKPQNRLKTKVPISNWCRDADVFAYYDQNDAWKEIAQFELLIREDSLNSIDWLGSDYLLVQSIIESARNSIAFREVDFNLGKNDSIIRQRENFLASNLIQQLKSKPNQKFFGQFGATHVPYEMQAAGYLREQYPYKWESMINIVLSDQAVEKNEVLSMQIIYNNAQLRYEYQKFFQIEAKVLKNYSREIGRNEIGFLPLAKNEYLYKNNFSALIFLP